MSLTFDLVDLLTLKAYCSNHSTLGNVPAKFSENRTGRFGNTRYNTRIQAIFDNFDPGDLTRKPLVVALIDQSKF